MRISIIANTFASDIRECDVSVANVNGNNARENQMKIDTNPMHGEVIKNLLD